MVNSYEFLTKLCDAGKKIRSNADRLVKLTEKNLEHYEESRSYNEDDPSPDLPEWDPALRHSILSDGQCRYLISRSPHQPRLSKFPKDSNIASNKQQQFSVNWYDEYPHLEYSIQKDAAFCFVCSLFQSHGTGHQAWTVDGVSTWNRMKSVGKEKKGKLAGHFTSAEHTENVKAFARFTDPLCHVDVMLDIARRNLAIQEAGDRFENRQIVEILFDVCKTLARQDIAFRGDGPLEVNGNFNQIVLMLARHCPVLDRWLKNRNGRAHSVTYMSNTSQNEMINLIGNAVRKIVISEVKSAGMFGVSADTTPDLSRRDQLAVVVRYVKEMIPNERLLALKPVTAKTGIATAEEIVQVLTENTLNTDELVSQSYDFASTMSGQYNGAQHHVQNIVGHDVPYMPCQSHRSNSVVEHACKGVVISEMFVTLESLYTFFSSSTKR